MLIPLTPVPKPRMVQSDRWRKRPATTRYWAFKDQLRILYPHPLASELELIFYLPMPKSWSQKKRLLMNGKPHQQKPDIDNLTKAIMDCLADEDQQVWSIYARKFWSEGGSIELVIKETL